MKRLVLWTLVASAAGLAGVGARPARGADGESGESSARGLAARMRAQAEMAGCGLTSTVDLARAIPALIKAPGAEPGPAWTDEPWGMIAPLDERFQAAACFDRDNPPSLEIQDAVERLMRGFITDRFVLNSSWPGSNNVPINLTWSFVPDGTSIPGSPSVGEPTSNSSLFSTMDSRFGAANRALWIAQFQACFDRWGELTGVRYTRVMNNGNAWDDGAPFPSSAGSTTAGATRGDVRIAAHPIDGSGGVLAYNYFPVTGDMVLDSNETWNFGAPWYHYLRNTVMHEHGHGLGLAHVCPATGTKLMEPFITTDYDGPRHDDIRGAQYSYGDFYEANNSQTTAADLGVLASGATLNPSQVPGASVDFGSRTGISLDGDTDWFKFTVDSPALATITVTPVGQSYADYVQDASCSSTTANVDSRVQADLVLDYINASGSTMATSNGTSFGGTETLSNVLLSPPGTLYVRVRENNVPVETQLYSLTIQSAGPPMFTASDGTFTDRVRLNWASIPNTTNYWVYRSTTSVRATAITIASVSSATLQWDDFSANTSTTYYYWIEVNTGVGGQRPMAGPDTGFRGSLNAPANDACANATPVSSGAVVNGTLNAASNDGTASCGIASTSPDVWYSFSALCAGTLTVSTCSTNDLGGVDTGIDTVLSLWSACPSGGGVELACNDTGACAGMDVGLARDASITRAMANGESVRIRVSRPSTGSSGTFVLRVNFGPSNDACATATTINANAPAAFCNVYATTDGPSEPACMSGGSGQITGDVWYRYTPGADGRWTARTCGSGFDTRLAVYAASAGCPAAAGAVLACADDTTVCPPGGVTAQTSVSVIGDAGAAYLIRVGGSGGAVGDGVLTVYCAGDFNFSGDVTVQDIFDFLAAYFSGNFAADVNQSGQLGTQDIFDFLASFFGGC